MATDKKRVQAFLSDSLHESLSEYARVKDLSLSAAIAEVLGDYFGESTPLVEGSENSNKKSNLYSQEIQSLKNQMIDLTEKIQAIEKVKQFESLVKFKQELSTFKNEIRREQRAWNYSAWTQLQKYGLSEELNPYSESVSESVSESSNSIIEYLTTDKSLFDVNQNDIEEKDPRSLWAICEFDGEDVIAIWTGKDWISFSQEKDLKLAKLYTSEARANTSIMKLRDKHPKPQTLKFNSLFWFKNYLQKYNS